MNEQVRRELMRTAARAYLAQGYLIAADDERGIALTKPKRANALAALVLGPLYWLGWAVDRDRWIFLTATDAGEIIVRRGDARYEPKGRSYLARTSIGVLILVVIGAVLFLITPFIAHIAAR
jgi:hypothetical protein